MLYNIRMTFLADDGDSARSSECCAFRGGMTYANMRTFFRLWKMGVEESLAAAGWTVRPTRAKQLLASVDHSSLHRVIRAHTAPIFPDQPSLLDVLDPSDYQHIEDALVEIGFVQKNLLRTFTFHLPSRPVTRRES